MNEIGGIFTWRVFREGECVALHKVHNLTHGPFIADLLQLTVAGQTVGVVSPAPTSFHAGVYGLFNNPISVTWTWSSTIGTYASRYGTTNIESTRVPFFPSESITAFTESSIINSTSLRQVWNPTTSTSAEVGGAVMSWTFPTSHPTVLNTAGFFGIMLFTDSPTISAIGANGRLMASGIFSWVQTSVYTVLPQIIFLRRGETLQVEYTLRLR